MNQIFIITAPSGAGKTSLVSALLKSDDSLSLSISHTTRTPRDGEQDGRDYHFVDKNVFMQMVSEGKFVESAEVFGNFYGTASQSLQTGKDIVLEIDYQGAAQVKALFAHAVLIFVLPPSVQALHSRLSARAQDSQSVIDARLAGATQEMRQYVNFDYVIINDNFSTALTDLQSIVRAERLRILPQSTRYNDVISTLLA